jgi:hypothetical protein
MRILTKSVRASLAILAPMVAAAPQASAEPISRSNWLPNVAQLNLAGGDQLPERAVDLGGGPRRQAPRWAVDLGKAPVGPGLDDEDVPHGLEFLESDRNRSAASPDAFSKE